MASALRPPIAAVFETAGIPARQMPDEAGSETSAEVLVFSRVAGARNGTFRTLRTFGTKRNSVYKGVDAPVSQLDGG
jgi:hypothetical protein